MLLKRADYSDLVFWPGASRRRQSGTFAIASENYMVSQTEALVTTLHSIGTARRTSLRRRPRVENST
eukprot:569095-Amphidinium_carterae.1